MENDITEILTDTGYKAMEAQQYLTEAAAVMLSDCQANMRGVYISPKEQKDRQAFLCILLAQIEQCHNAIVKNIRTLAKAEMMRLFNEQTHGLYKAQAPQIVEELAERMKCEGII